ncbi:MAG: hypothetical protein JNN06_08515 [Gemmobacter sp.]|uniref:hypothetical protein n=1 Tax=Gemmobacter sp. TaxID=1898957 RepID=UPI001A5BC5FC|nr:hypothetical protein [Gemmobacter sp.]MBL8562308.1 hypothetical protein [Gemmobacter sp.]
MSQITRDPLLTGPRPLAEGEVLLETFRPDRGVYLRNTLILMVVFGVIAGGVLVAIGDPNPWVGPLAAILGIGARAWFLASEALAAEWRLTDRRLLGPAGQVIARADLIEARKVFGEVAVITRAGEKFLIKYPADPEAVIAQLNGAKA